MRLDPDYAREMDAGDELAPFRDRFVIAEPDLVYMDGNSLGRLPRASAILAEELVSRQWGEGLIGSWNDHWIGLPARIGGKIARLLGAREDEVLVADSTSVNLFKLALAALQARPGRSRIVTDALNFPSDVYVLQSAARLASPAAHVEIVPSADGLAVPPEALEAAIDDETALLALSHTSFKSAYTHDLARVTALAHGRGALVLWDVSHSVGAMPLGLGEAGADLAVGCAYKYLCGGPGAPAFLYVRRELQQELRNPIGGWFGHEDPFRFELEYRPAPGMASFLTGTPPVVSLALIEPGVDLVLEAGIERLRAKSVHQTSYLADLWEALLEPLGFGLNSPRDALRRGSHVSFSHPEGLRISRALIDRRRVVPDFRAPDNIRLGVSPLYTTYSEVHAAVDALRTVVSERLYEAYPAERHGAT